MVSRALGVGKDPWSRPEIAQREVGGSALRLHEFAQASMPITEVSLQIAIGSVFSLKSTIFNSGNTKGRILYAKTGHNNTSDTLQQKPCLLTEQDHNTENILLLESIRSNSLTARVRKCSMCLVPESLRPLLAQRTTKACSSVQVGESLAAHCV